MFSIEAKNESAGNNNAERQIKQTTQTNRGLFFIDLDKLLHFRQRLRSSQQLSDVPTSTSISSCWTVSPPLTPPQVFLLALLFRFVVSVSLLRKRRQTSVYFLHQKVGVLNTEVILIN